MLIKTKLSISIDQVG